MENLFVNERGGSGPQFWHDPERCELFTGDRNWSACSKAGVVAIYAAEAKEEEEEKKEEEKKEYGLKPNTLEHSQNMCSEQSRAKVFTRGSYTHALYLK